MSPNGHSIFQPKASTKFQSFQNAGTRRPAGAIFQCRERLSPRVRETSTTCPCRKLNPVCMAQRESGDAVRMLGHIRLIFGLVIDLFRSRAALEAEVLVLRQRLTVLRRSKPNPTAIHGCRPVGVGLDLPAVSERSQGPSPSYDRRPVVRWHRAGFRSYWRLEVERLGPVGVEHKLSTQRHQSDRTDLYRCQARTPSVQAFVVELVEPTSASIPPESHSLPDFVPYAGEKQR